MSTFTNCYYKRVSGAQCTRLSALGNVADMQVTMLQTAGTPKACYACSRPTTTVLSTVDTVDWVYTCDSHLKDPGFASPLDDGPKKTGLTPEQIVEVTKDWEERQKRKQEKAKEKEQEKEEKVEDGKESKGKDPKETSKPATPKPSTPSTLSTPAPSHQRYALHRDMFAMRLAEHRKRRQAAQAKELAPRLPGAPRQPLPSA